MLTDKLLKTKLGFYSKNLIENSCEENNLDKLTETWLVNLREYNFLLLWMVTLIGNLNFAKNLKYPFSLE